MEHQSRTELLAESIVFAQRWVDGARRLAYGVNQELDHGASLDVVQDALGSAAMKLEVAHAELSVHLHASYASGQRAAGESPF